MYIRILVRVTSVYVCMFVCLPSGHTCPQLRRVRMHTNIRTYAYVCSFVCSYVFIRSGRVYAAKTYVYIRINTYTYVYVCIRMYVCIRTYTWTNVHVANTCDCICLQWISRSLLFRFFSPLFFRPPFSYPVSLSLPRLLSLPLSLGEASDRWGVRKCKEDLKKTCKILRQSAKNKK